MNEESIDVEQEVENMREESTSETTIEEETLSEDDEELTLTNKTTLRDAPLQEITLRKYEEPIGLEKKEVARKFLLSVGLLQPGESRDILVDIFYELINARTSKQILGIPQLLERLKSKPGASASNIRRQLRRLRAFKLADKTPQGYRITEFGKLEPVINNYIEQFVIKPSLERIRAYARKLDE